jgi:acyl carrier protein
MPIASNTTTVTDDIRQFVTDNFLFGKGEGLRDGESLLDLGVIDSTGVLELIQFIEERYGITVEDEEAIPQNLDGVNSLANYVCRKLTVAS